MDENWGEELTCTGNALDFSKDGEIVVEGCRIRIHTLVVVDATPESSSVA
jgi:hypothetical protein